VLNVVILSFTLGVGWLIWFIIVAPRGQSPGKQLLGMYIIKADGTRAGGWYTWLRTIVVRVLLSTAIDLVAFGFYSLIASLWCIWDKEQQCLWDKIAGTRIAYSPMGYRPPTANELYAAGMPMPAMRSTAAAPLYAPSPAQALGPPPIMRPPSIADQLTELTRLREAGIISEQEFDIRRQRLMQQL